MAYCPECGGSVRPAQFMTLRPAAARCRWCGAHVVQPLWGRLLRDGLLVLLGAVASTWGGIRFLETGNDLWLFLVPAGVGVGLVLGVILETMFPLRAIVPRGVAPWRRLGLDRRVTGEEAD